MEVEQSVLGWDHTQLGHAVGRKWRLPATVLAAIRWHHDPVRAGREDTTIVHTVAVANFLCSLKGLTSVGIDLVSLSRESLAELGLDKADLEILTADLDYELTLHRHLFEIQRGAVA